MKVVDEALSVSDPKVYELVRAEERRQSEKIRLIPSENYVSRAVLEASGSVFTNKYSEGYAQKRYYEGQQNVDPLESLVDLTSKNVPGKVAAKALDKAGIELNYNSVPYDTRKPFDPSGIRLGTPSVTSRGMGEAEMKQIAAWIDRVVGSPNDDTAAKVLTEVLAVTRRFPAPGILLK
jgi:glycine/serine hydroxymethyltransferase